MQGMQGNFGDMEEMMKRMQMQGMEDQMQSIQMGGPQSFKPAFENNGFFKKSSRAIDDDFGQGNFDDDEQEKDEPVKEHVPSSDEFIEGSLKKHNEFRRMHGIPDLYHNPELSKHSKAYAQQLAATDNMKHSNCQWESKKVGENLAMCGGYMMTP